MKKPTSNSKTETYSKRWCITDNVLYISKKTKIIYYEKEIKQTWRGFLFVRLFASFVYTFYLLCVIFVYCLLFVCCLLFYSLIFCCIMVKLLNPKYIFLFSLFRRILFLSVPIQLIFIIVMISCSSLHITVNLLFEKKTKNKRWKN